MAKYVEKTAKTVQIAINEALEELGVTVDDVLIEVLDEGDEGRAWASAADLQKSGFQ